MLLSDVDDAPGVGDEVGRVDDVALLEVVGHRGQAGRHGRESASYDGVDGHGAEVQRSEIERTAKIASNPTPCVPEKFQQAA